MKMKWMKRLLPVTSLLVVLTLAAGSTYAWFVAQKSTNIPVTCASFDVEYKAEFAEGAFDTIAPGDIVESEAHEVENSSDIPMLVEIKPEVSSDISIPEGMIDVSLPAEYTKIDNSYYIKLPAKSSAKAGNAMKIRFDGELMDNNFNSTTGLKQLNILLTATGVQVRQDAAAFTFGAETAQKLADAGFFSDSKAAPHVEIASVESYGNAVFTFSANKDWQNSITSIKTSDWDYWNNKFVTRTVNMKSWVTIEDGKLTIGNGSIRVKDFFQEYTKTVTISADGYPDVVVDVTHLTKK